MEQPENKEQDWADWFFVQDCTFIMGVVKLQDLPEFGLPEVAFIGRSNVGKSSLINGLVGRKKIARTSNTPGRTQELNFFSLANMLLLVDLPGYGYAEAPKKLVEKWQKVMKGYLRGRPTLQRAYLLIDSRHGIKENDIEMMKMLDEVALSYQIILTKFDKLKISEQNAVYEKTQAQVKEHPAAHPVVIATSSATGHGMGALRREIAHFAQKPAAE
ncbi:MAG: ribosome biogenesis GTP-binding protein YihA/YsxC [Alphaproteobacteria bacterium]|nr:ribosome biogenesis GTP-binding protein YihA/YsxC [Alphaproteobacteria bacterium]